MNSRGIAQGENWVTTSYKNDKGEPVNTTKKIESVRFPCWGHYPPHDGHELEFFNEFITKKYNSRGVDIEAEIEDGPQGVFWVCFWHQGIYSSLPSFRSWKERISDAWRLLRGETLHYEEFVFDVDTAEKMGEYIVEKSKEMRNR